MQRRKSLSYLIAAPVLALAIAAPAAPAMPIQEARQADMYSSTVQKPKPTTQYDLRGEAAAYPAYPTPSEKPKPTTPDDLRGEAVADPKPVPAPPVGLPTWPRSPEVIPPLGQEPVAVSDDGDDINVPLSILALAGAALLGGTLGIAGARRQQTRTVG